VDGIEEGGRTPKWLCIGNLFILPPMCLFDGYQLITRFSAMATSTKIIDVLALLISPVIIWVCVSDLKRKDRAH
jgi:hypothetical protein